MSSIGAIRMPAAPALEVVLEVVADLQHAPGPRAAASAARPRPCARAGRAAARRRLPPCRRDRARPAARRRTMADRQVRPRAGGGRRRQRDPRAGNAWRPGASVVSVSNATAPASRASATSASSASSCGPSRSRRAVRACGLSRRRRPARLRAAAAPARPGDVAPSAGRLAARCAQLGDQGGSPASPGRHAARSRSGSRTRGVAAARPAGTSSLERHQLLRDAGLLGDCHQRLAPLGLLDLAGAGQQRVEVAVLVDQLRPRS